MLLERLMTWVVRSGEAREAGGTVPSGSDDGVSRDEASRDRASQDTASYSEADGAAVQARTELAREANKVVTEIADLVEDTRGLIGANAEKVGSFHSEPLEPFVEEPLREGMKARPLPAPYRRSRRRGDREPPTRRDRTDRRLQKRRTARKLHVRRR